IVHPDYYSTDDPDSAPESLGQQIIHWQEQNLRQHHAQRQPTIEIFGRCRSGHPHYANSYESCGYQAVRWFCTLERSLTSSIPTPEFPDGFSLCPASQVSPEAWVDLFNQTFIDHWNFKPVTVSDRQFRLAYPTYQPELDWVALAPDGRPAGFCSAIIDRDRNQQTGENIGWIGLLGTRRGYRRRGLARAMLLYGLQQLQADGLTTARIGVDADNPNQAQTLYESVGFQVTKSWVTYQKELSLG
ncbi:MAG: N-acetyltransferase family protein, partial [Leptolyngbyaceae cyanobacterium]